MLPQKLILDLCYLGHSQVGSMVHRLDEGVFCSSQSCRRVSVEVEAQTSGKWPYPLADPWSPASGSSKCQVKTLNTLRLPCWRGQKKAFWWTFPADAAFWPSVKSRAFQWNRLVPCRPAKPPPTALVTGQSVHKRRGTQWVLLALLIHRIVSKMKWLSL